MPDLSALIERLEGASGKLDIDTLGRAICAGYGVEYGAVGVAYGDDGSDELSVIGANDETVWSGYRSRAPDVSTDAALAFVERALPGWEWERKIAIDGPFIRLVYGDWHVESVRGNSGPERSADASDTGSTPLAILIAALKALQERGAEQ